MNKKDILKRIITRKGSCDWVTEEARGLNPCNFCPLSRLRKKPNGDYYSCYESVCGDTAEEDSSRIDKMYQEAAVKALLDISMDEELGLDEGEYAFKD